ncbi:hypothetical protein GCM10028819_27070 [Spirosoma humi]
MPFLTKKRLLVLLLGCSGVNSLAQQSVTISSPNRSLVLTAQNTPTGEVTYQVRYKGKSVIEPSGLGFVLSKPAVSLTRFTLTRVDSSDG